MDRRKFLIGAGGTVAGGSALLGSGAFSRVESQRSVTVAVAEDPGAYLGLDKCDTRNGSYAHLDSQGHLRLYLDDENPTIGDTPLGLGINSNSTSWFDNVFQLCNQGKEPVCVHVEDSDAWPLTGDSDRRVEFYLGDDDSTSIIGESNAFALDVGQCACAGVKTRSYGLSEGDNLLDTLDDEVRIIADVDGNCFDDVDERVPDVISITASPNTAGKTDSVHRVEVPVGSTFDGQTFSSLTVGYPADFDIDGVEPGDIISAGVQRTDTSITSVSISGTSDSDGDTAVTLTTGGGVTLSADDTIFVEYRNVTNASTPDDYTVLVDIDGSSIGPGTLTITPDTGSTGPVTSTFDSGDNGWEIVGDAQGGASVPDYETGEGNLAPSISATDDVQGGTWYFSAPGKFLADKSVFYGGTLEYDLLQEYSGSPSQFGNTDIELQGSGVTLSYDHGGTSTHPGGGDSGIWTSYSVGLDESDNWMIGGTTATQSEVQAVLGDVTGLEIRGEYRSGSDKGYLDNVEMTPP